MSFIHFKNSFYSGETYYMTMVKDAIKSIVVNPSNEIVFSFGKNDDLRTVAYATQEQANKAVSYLLAMWDRKFVNLPSPSEMAEFLQEDTNGQDKDS